MKIIFLSTYDCGGAGNVLYNLNDGLLSNGHESFMVVKTKTTSSKNVSEVSSPFLIFWIKSLINYLLSKVFTIITNLDYYFLNERESFKTFPTKYILKQFPFTPDVILVGWVSGFVNTKSIYELKKNTNAKIVYLLTDMGNLTGGCHYDMHCNGYTADCNNCPAILNDLAKGRASKNLQIKKKYIKLSDAFVIPGSIESTRQALNSSLFEKDKILDHILAPVDSTIFNNQHRDIAKNIFNLNRSKKVIFAGSANVSEKRKGITYLYEALKYIEKNNPEIAENCILLLVGDNSKNTILETLSLFELKRIDFIKDDRFLSLAFQASEIYVSPTIYDSGPLMVKQALSCALPVVAFNVGASEELVISGKTGHLCNLYNVECFADGIIRLLTLSNEEYNKMSKNCIEHANALCSKTSVVNRFTNIINKST